MLQYGADHKFIYCDVEISSALELADVILAADAKELYPGGDRDKGRSKWDAMVEQFRKDLPDIRIWAPIVDDMADMVQFLSCSSEPRIGYVRQRGAQLREVCETALAAAQDATTRRRSAEWTCSAFLDDVMANYGDDVIDHDLYVMAEGLTPNRAAVEHILDAHRNGVKKQMGVVKQLVFSTWQIEDDESEQAAAGAGEPAPAVLPSLGTRLSPAAIASLAAAAVKKQPTHLSAADARLAKYEAEWSSYMAALDDMVKRLSRGERFTDLDAMAKIRGQVPRVAALARKVLATQPTQTASERIFSRLRLVTAGRHSLGEQRIELFTLAAANVRKFADLHASFRPAPVPLDDDPEVEPSRVEDDTEDENDASSDGADDGLMLEDDYGVGAGAAGGAAAAHRAKRSRHAADMY